MQRTVAERLAQLEAEAQRLTRLLVEGGATLVVAFGSFARADVGLASDLDLIAVMDSDLPFINRLERLYSEMKPEVGLDLLVYTPSEFEWMRERAFIRDALSEGRVLHAA
jgi:predicted nucleotidyltransferase